MKLVPIIILVATLVFSGPVLGAPVQELSASELRKIASSRRTISLKRVIDSVAKSTGAQPVEARAFEADDIYYRIVLKEQNGQLLSVIINARTGEQIARSSPLGILIIAAATANASGTGQSQAAGGVNNAGGTASGVSIGSGGVSVGSSGVGVSVGGGGVSVGVGGGSVSIGGGGASVNVGGTSIGIGKK